MSDRPIEVTRIDSIPAHPKKRLLLGLTGVGIIAGITGIGVNELLRPVSTLAQTVTEPSFFQRAAILNRTTEDNLQLLEERYEEIAGLGVEVFVSGMAEHYGIPHDPELLKPQIKIVSERDYKESIFLASGCRVVLYEFIHPNEGGRTLPGWPRALVNATSVSRSLSSNQNLAAELVGVELHELGHQTPKLNTDPDQIREFASAIEGSGLNLVGTKGFGLVTSKPTRLSWENPDCLTLGRLEEQNRAEEIFVDHNRLLFLADAGIETEYETIFAPFVQKFRDLILHRLTDADRRMMGRMQQDADLLGFMDFYRQNFGIEGRVTDAFADLNKLLSR